MAGHSHWAGIKHKKGRADKERSKIFSKISREITVAAKLGDKDPNMNPRLRTAIQPNLIPAAKLKNCLTKAEGAHRFEDIRDNDIALAKDKFLSVVSNANQMRERFTILDLAVLLGIIPGEIEQLIDEWVTR